MCACVRARARLYLLLFVLQSKGVDGSTAIFSSCCSKGTPPKTIASPPVIFCISVSPVTSVLYFLCSLHFPESVCESNFGKKKPFVMSQRVPISLPGDKTLRTLLFALFLPPIKPMNCSTRKTVNTGLNGRFLFFSIIHWKNFQEEK